MRISGAFGFVRAVCDQRRVGCSRAFVSGLQPATSSLESSLHGLRATFANQFHAIFIRAAKPSLRGCIKQTSLGQEISVQTFDLRRPACVQVHPPVSHVITVRAEVRDLTSRIIVVEPKTVQTSVLVIRLLWRWPQPSAIVHCLGNRHRIPARSRADLVVVANLGHDLFDLANLSRLHRLANKLADRIGSLLAARL